MSEENQEDDDSKYPNGYEAHKEKMRKKYHNDPEYRQSVKEATKRSKEREKEKRRERLRTERIARRNKKKKEYEEKKGSGRGKRGIMNERLVREDGEYRILQPAGKLEIESGLSLNAIQDWTNKDVMPFEVRRDENDQRWFTREQVEFMSQMILRHWDYHNTLDDFAEFLEEKWEEF